MKIGVYSDLHISRTSSIMPLYTGDNKYTTRLQMILDTAKWMYQVFDEQDVDIIVNCGDTLDSSTVKAEELSALSEFYKMSRGIPEYHIVGNHEIKDGDRSFYSTSVLSNFHFIRVIDRPTIEKNRCDIAFLPYMKPEDISYDMIRNMKSKILFSHVDIKGSCLRGDYIMDTGVDPELLAENFELVVNGHLHTPEIIKTTKNCVQNIGSVSSISFVDNSKYIPSICVIDTDTLKITRFKNPASILFRKLTVSRVSDLIEYLKSLSDHKHILSITCPQNIKDEIREILSNSKKICASRVLVDMRSYKTSSENLEGVSTDNLSIMDMRSEFIKFLKSYDGTVYASPEEYDKVLGIEVS